MRTKKDEEPEDKILNLLSKHKDFEQYRMPKETALSYRTILRKLQPLEEEGFIICVRTEPSEKGGKEKKIYAITLKGLWAYLFTVHKKGLQRNTLDKIIHRFPDFLLTFKKWSLFEKANIQDRMMYYFLTSLEMTWKTVTGAFGTIGERVEKTITDEYLRAWLDEVTLVSPLMDKATREFVSPVYLQDKEILEVVKKFLDRWERQQKQIIEIKNWLGDKS